MESLIEEKRNEVKELDAWKKKLKKDAKSVDKSGKLPKTADACEAKLKKLKEQIAAGADFADVAKEHSSCPSSRKGGALGTFGPGQMVKEFNDVVFSDEVGVVHGPVKTQFGYHLILITSRDD